MQVTLAVLSSWVWQPCQHFTVLRHIWLLPGSTEQEAEVFHSFQLGLCLGRETYEKNYAFSLGSFKGRESEFLLSQYEVVFTVSFLRWVFYTSLATETSWYSSDLFPKVEDTGHLWGFRYEAHKWNPCATDTQSPSNWGCWLRGKKRDRWLSGG